MRARSDWRRRVGLVLATLSLALYTLVVAPHVHAANESPNDCPVWAAHGPAGAAVEAPEIVLDAPAYVVVASDPLPSSDIVVARAGRPFAARGPPASIA